MEAVKWNQSLKHVLKQRNYSYCAIAVLTLALMLSLMANIKKSAEFEVTLLPTGLTEKSVIGSKTVSDSYLIQWAEFIASLRLNVTPDTIASLQAELLPFVDSSIYGDFKKSLLSEQQEVVAGEISTVFHPKTTQVEETNKPIVRVTGQLRTIIGDDLHQSMQVSYLLGFKLNHGRLLLTQFEEVSRA